MPPPPKKKLPGESTQVSYLESSSEYCVKDQSVFQETLAAGFRAVVSLSIAHGLKKSNQELVRIQAGLTCTTMSYEVLWQHEGEPELSAYCLKLLPGFISIHVVCTFYRFLK